MPKSKNKRKNAGKKKSSTAPVVEAIAAAAASTESAAPKVGPVKYVGQVRQEARRVVWPGWPEVWKTTILVMILFVLMGAFFFIVDWALANIVQFVLGLGA
jgi:preprotein translocase subunit SecE